METNDNKIPVYNLQINHSEENDGLHTSLGISEERHKELKDLVDPLLAHNILDADKTVADLLKGVAAHANTPEEFAYVVFRTGLNKQKIDSNPLMSALAGLGRHAHNIVKEHEKKEETVKA